MKCDKCLKKIDEGETYYELQEWEMSRGEGFEVGETRICDFCYRELKKFLLPK